MKCVSRIILAAVFVCAASGVSLAQQVTAVLRGTVYDPSGATVSSVTVTATQIETGFSRSASTDAQGDFVLVELPVGHYKLQADAKGFQRFIREGLTLEVNQTALVAVRLVIGTDARQIEVTADAPLIENTTSTVDQQTIRDPRVSSPSPSSRSSATSTAAPSGALSKKTKPFSSFTTKASASAPAKPRKPPCHPPMRSRATLPSFARAFPLLPISMATATAWTPAVPVPTARSSMFSRRRHNRFPTTRFRSSTQFPRIFSRTTRFPI